MNTFLEKNFLWILFLISLILIILIFSPYLSSIILGFILWILFNPLFNFIDNFIKNKSLSAFITVFLILIIIFVPLFFITFRIIKEFQSYIFVFDFNEFFLKDLTDKFNIDFDLTQFYRQIINGVLSTLQKAFSLTVDIGVSIFLSFFILFYLFKQSKEFKDFIFKISPLSQSQNNKIFDNLYKSIHSIIYGFLIVALIQGFLAAIGFYIFKVPNALLFGLLAVFAALVPMIGTGLVVLPLVLYLFLSQNYFNALGLLIWGLLVVGTIDNFLRPYLLQKKLNISAVFILISVLGGINYFGPIGFIIGPLILAFFISILDSIKELKKEK